MSPGAGGHRQYRARSRAAWREEIVAISSFPDRYAEALGDPRLTDAEVDALLDLARTVAHATERRYAPLSTYLAGRFVATRTAAGVALDVALAEAVALGRRAVDDDPPSAE